MKRRIRDVIGQLVFDFVEDLTGLVRREETGRPVRPTTPAPPIPAKDAAPPPAAPGSDPAGEAGRELVGLLDGFGWRGPRNVAVAFYPYAQVYHTLRLRSGVLRLNLHESFRGAPAQAVRAAVTLLAAKICRRRVPVAARRMHDEYLRSLDPATVAKCCGRRPRRPAKDRTRGAFYDLLDLKDRVDRKYFGGTLGTVRITWSARRARWMLGSFDHARNRVTISRIFDRRDCPDYVLEYMVYHELLHARHPIGRRRDGKRDVHSRAFRRDERKCERYGDAMAWIRKMR